MPFYYGNGTILVLVALVTVILFGYTWLGSHRDLRTIHGHTDSMAGDEGED